MTGAAQTLRGWFGAARAELADKPRLRAGAWAIAALLLLYMLLAQADRLAAARDEHAGQAARAAALAGAVSRGDWAELLAEARAAAGPLEQRLWQADSAGHAQAQLQQRLTALAGQLGLSEARVQPGVSQPVPELPDVTRVQVQFVARYRSVGFLQLLLAIAESEKKMVVDRVSVRRDGSRASVLLSAYFLGIPPSGPQGDT